MVMAAKAGTLGEFRQVQHSELRAPSLLAEPAADEPRVELGVRGVGVHGGRVERAQLLRRHRRRRHRRGHRRRRGRRRAARRHHVVALGQLRQSVGAQFEFDGLECKSIENVKSLFPHRMLSIAMFSVHYSIPWYLLVLQIVASAHYHITLSCSVIGFHFLGFQHKHFQRIIHIY